MLKPHGHTLRIEHPLQPPSGGCVLKLYNDNGLRMLATAAAFGRLCVETHAQKQLASPPMAAAFGRLCVETPPGESMTRAMAAAAFGRLCVETERLKSVGKSLGQPPSGGCVLKRGCEECADASGRSRLRAAVC